MKQRITVSKSSLFLMELIIVVLVFALSAAICMRTFAAAKVSSELADDISHAIINTESAAECWRSTGGDLAAAAEILGGGISGEVYFAAYGAEWNMCARPDASYELTLSADSGAADITVTRLADGRELFSLDVKLPGGDVQ